MKEEIYDLPDPAELYHENSKLRRIDQDHFSWITFVGAAQSIRETLSRPFRIFRGKPQIPLGRPEELPRSRLSFEKITARRISDRSFEGPVSLDQAARILHCGYGITRTTSTPDGISLRFRTVPSAGALYPLELYLFAFDISGLDPGLYHYNVRDHRLELLEQKDFRETLMHVTLARDILEKAAGLVVISALFDRTRFKYRKQAYRFILFEAGHVSQNMMLAATSLELGTVAIGGFMDDELNEILDMDGVNEAALYLLALGKPAENLPEAPGI